MALPGCLVVQHPAGNGSQSDSVAANGGWEIIVGDQSDRLAADVPPGELAVCANLLAQTAGIKNLNVVIAPASTSCFFVKLKPSDDIDLRDRAALTYELEDHLPIDAESMAADFVPIESPSGEAGTIGALAIPLHPWHSIVEAFESADLPVRSLVPSSVLAARERSEGGDLAETVRWLLVDGPRCDCICVRNETILSWNHLATDESALRRQLLLDHAESDRTMVVGADPRQLELIRSIVPEARLDETRLGQSVRRGASLLLDNRSQRWFDLRRDALGPSDPLRAISKQLRWVAVAAAICFLALAIGGWWRSSRIDSEIDSIRNQQADLFREAFPDARIPGAVLTRVRSEYTRVAKSRGKNLDVEIPPSATMILRELIAALPDNIRYQIEEIVIDNGTAKIPIVVNKSGDAGDIADAIKRHGFQVPDIGSNARDGNPNEWESEIEATWIGHQSDKGTAG